MKALNCKAIWIVALVVTVFIFGVYCRYGFYKPTSNKEVASSVTPVLRELDFGDSFKGSDTPLQDGWLLYKNKIIGFEVEHPAGQYVYEKMNEVIKGSLMHKVYSVFMSGDDTEFVGVEVMATQFHNINEWIKNDPDYQNPQYVFLLREIAGGRGVTKYYTPDAVIPEDRLQRTTYVIKDDIVYSITMSEISNEKYERVLKSFSFI